MVVVKCVLKLKNCQIGTKIGVVVDIDPVIIIVVTKRQKGKKTKIQKYKNTKIQKDKRTKGQKDKKTKRQKWQKDKKTKKNKKKQDKQDKKDNRRQKRQSQKDKKIKIQKYKRTQGQKDKKTTTKKDNKKDNKCNNKTKKKYKKYNNKKGRTKKKKIQRQGAQRARTPSTGARTRRPATPKVLVLYNWDKSCYSSYPFAKCPLMRHYANAYIVWQFTNHLGILQIAYFAKCLWHTYHFPLRGCTLMMSCNFGSFWTPPHHAMSLFDYPPPSRPNNNFKKKIQNRGHKLTTFRDYNGSQYQKN